MDSRFTIFNTSNSNIITLFRIVFLCAYIFIFNDSFASTEITNNETYEVHNDFVISSSGVPKGFEDLAGPQFNQIDVYYQGKFLISTEATYDFETLTFHDPETLVSHISNLIDRDHIKKHISSPLPTNTDKLCLSHNSDLDCGKLEPNIVGIIFDEGHFRADIFINRRYVETQFIESSKYLPAAADKFSTIHNLNLNLSGTDAIEDTFNIQTNSIVSFGETRLLAQSNYTDEEDLLIDEISLQKDYQGWEAEAGVFESEARSTNFFSQVDITGFRAKTSLNTRTDIDTSSGTNIFIFLDVRSRVEVFRNNRLIDARFYDAGNRQLDTSRFPDGAYQISVRIREETGGERTEQYFFVRNSLLPPINEPVLFAEVGKVNELQQETLLPDTIDDSIAHAGGAFRISENIAVEAEVLSTEKQQMVQAGVVHVGSGLQSQINVMTTTESDWGIAVRENYATNSFSLDLDFRYIHQGDNDIVDFDEFDLVTRDTTQATASLVHELFGGRTFWRYRHLDLSDSEKSETYSVNYRKQLLRRQHYQLDWEFGASRDTDDYLINTKLEFTFRKKNNIFRLSGGAQRTKTNNSRENDVISNARWQHTKRNPKYGRLQSQLFHIKEVDFNTVGLNLTSESRYGFNEIEVNRTNNDGENTFGYALRSQLSLASDFNTASLGGAQRNNSAIIINLDGQPQGAKFEVYVDRQSVGFADVGKSTVIPLAPYETYDVRLESRSDTFLAFDQTPREVTLYPGNVNSLIWQVDRVLVLIGKIVDIHGQPIKNARINNVDTFAGTDDRGWFQIETGKTQSLEIQQKDGAICKVNLGDYNQEEDVHVFDELVCSDISTTVTGL